MEIKIGDRFRWSDEPSFEWEVISYKPMDEVLIKIYSAKCISSDDNNWEVGKISEWSFQSEKWIYLGNFNKE